MYTCLLATISTLLTSVNTTVSQYPMKGRYNMPLHQASLFFFCFDTQSNCLPNHPSLVTFLATSTSYSMLRHLSRSSLMEHTCNFVQMHISTFFDILELCPLRPGQQIGGLPVRSWFATEPRIACNG